MKSHDPWGEDLDILSAENVNFALETAGLGSRFGAAMIDLALQCVVILLVLIAAVRFLDLLPSGYVWSKWARALLTAAGVLGLALLTLGYGFFFEWLCDGQTPGKRILGLRVMQMGGTPITAWEAMIRSLLRAVDFLPLFYGLGAAVALLSSNNRRIGDLVAGTVVARERHESAIKHLTDIDAAAAAFLASCAQAPLPHAPLLQSAATTVADAPTVAASLAVVSTSAATSAASVVADLPGPAPYESVANTELSPIPVPVTVTLPAYPYLAGAGPPRPAAAAGVAAAALSEPEVELVQEYIMRRSTMKPLPRQRLAAALSARLCARLGQSAPSAVLADSWLEELALHILGERNSV
jgi:uncharacterized RDD family membrane protein YckC